MPTGYGLPNPYQWYTFGSQHTGGIVQFAFADGSVHAISTGINSNLEILEALCNITNTSPIPPY